jgi:hypothetical protein
MVGRDPSKVPSWHIDLLTPSALQDWWEASGGKGVKMGNWSTLETVKRLHLPEQGYFELRIWVFQDFCVALVFKI